MAKEKKPTKKQQATKTTRKGLDERQLAYCREFVIDFNQTQAAIRAGYSARSARNTASRLMANDDVAKEIGRLVKDRAERTEITADRVVRELAKIAFSNVHDVVRWNESGTYVMLKPMEEVDGALIGEVGNTENGVKVKLHDKMRALEALAKHTGVYEDRIVTTVNVTPYVEALKGTVKDVWADHKGEDDGED